MKQPEAMTKSGTCQWTPDDGNDDNSKAAILKEQQQSCESNASSSNLRHTAPSFNVPQQQDVSCDSLLTAPLNVSLEQRMELAPSTPSTTATADSQQPQSQTEATVTTTATTTETSSSIENERPDFCMGDHVYQWCSVFGIPAVFAHHGIVLDVFYHQDAKEWRLRVADFSNGREEGEAKNGLSTGAAVVVPTWEDGGSGDDDEAAAALESNNNSTNNHDEYDDDDDNDDGWNNVHTQKKKSFASSGSSRIRTYETDPALWKKVQYEAGFWRKHLSRGGTATSAASDPPGMVRARVQFLLDDTTQRLPPYRLVQSNCECVAVWCKTGTWATLQATSWLSAAAAGQVKSTATLVGAAASATVTTPAAGLWGWLGYTSQVSLLSTQPWLIPALAAYGVVSVGGPALWLALAQRHWKKMTEDLNTAFWEAAIENPDVFVECITYWSDIPDTNDCNYSVQEIEGQGSAASAVMDTKTNATMPPHLLPISAVQQLPQAAVRKLSEVNDCRSRQEESKPIISDPSTSTQVASQAPIEG